MKRMSDVLRLVAAVALMTACGSDSASGGFPTSGDSAHVGGTGADEGGPGTEAPFVPEEEIEVALQAPQGGDRYVFVVSTGLDAVVRIDGITLEVDLIEVGGQPTVMRTLGGEDALVVINEGTRDFSVVRSIEADQPPTVVTLDAPNHVNRLQVADDGRFATPRSRGSRGACRRSWSCVWTKARRPCSRSASASTR